MKKKTGLLFVLPGFIVIVCFTYAPLIFGFVMSLFGGKGQNINFVGIENYEKLMNDNTFQLSLINSLWFAIIIIPIILIFSIILSLCLYQIKNARLKRAFLFMLYLPCITSPVAYALFFKQIAYADGILTNFLSSIKLCFTNESILSNQWSARIYISIICVWAWTGFYVLIINAALQNIDRNIIKSTQIDGASNLCILNKIILHSIYPVIILVSVLVACSSLQIYIEIALITKGGPEMSTYTLVFYLYRKTFTYVADYGYSVTIGIIIMLFSLLISSIALFVRLVKSNAIKKNYF